MFRFNKTFLIISDFFIAFFSFILIFHLRYSWNTLLKAGERTLDSYTIILFLLYALCMITLSISLKIYELNKVNHIIESLFSNILVSIISMGIFGIYFYFTQTNFARFVFFVGFLIIPIFLSCYNKLSFILISNKKNPTKILYFGSNANFILFKELIDEYHKWFPVDLKKTLLNEDPKNLAKNLKKCDLLVADTDQKFQKKYLDILNNFEIDGGRIYSVIDMFAYFDQSLPAEIIQNNHYELFSTYKIDSFYSKYMKRIQDILISVILLIILSPLLGITFILIKLTSKGKAIYTQERSSTFGKTFMMYKFRSMKENAEKGKAEFTKETDDRITFIGKIIRPLRIDELPQLVNIIKGEMSFIGPRPERPEVMKRIIKKCPLFKKRLLIKPGLSGWAQVKYKYVNKIEKMNKKLSYDLFYINNLSLVFDIKILLYTLETIIFRRGAI